MNDQPIDCDKGHRYFVHVTVPSGDEMVAPTVPQSQTGITARFTRLHSSTAPAIHADLDNLPMTGDPVEADLYYVDVSMALHQTHLKTLGRGKRYYVLYPKSGVASNDADSFLVAIGTNI